VLASAAGEQVFGRAVEGKSAQVAGDPDQPHTYTYVPDIGKGLVILGEREEALGQAWHLPSPETLTTREFVGMIFEEESASRHARPDDTEDRAAGFRSVQPCHPRDYRDALRVRGTFRRRCFQVRAGVRRASDAAEGSRPAYRTVVVP
jgi:nucleoside-diphosphate-sugar epimerase